MMVYVQFCTDLKLHNFTSLQDQSDSEGRKKESRQVLPAMPIFHARRSLMNESHIDDPFDQ